MNLKGMPKIDNGCAGTVYDIGNNTCYKKIVHHEYTNIKDRGKILETIKNLKLYNFCRILSIDYDQDGNVIGYKMPYLHSTNMDILGLPKDYLLDSYHNLSYSMDLLAKNGIYANDFGLHNAFITYDGIIAYDYDMYINHDSYAAKLRNMAKLNAMFNELVSLEFEKKYPYLAERISIDKINSLFNSQTNPHVLEELLKKYNRIIEYIKDKNAKVR